MSRKTFADKIREGNEKKCLECVYHGAKVDQSSCWACTNYDLFRKKDENIVKPISPTKLEDMFQEIKKNFNYKDTDPVVYTSKTLNQQFDEWVKELKQETAKQIIEEIDNRLHDMAMEYYKAHQPTYFAVCEMVHYKVIEPIEKKYTGEQKQ